MFIRLTYCLFLTFVTLCLLVGGEKTTIHVVTHSHLDAGWIYDLNRCYNVVKDIFNTVLDSLLKNKERKYTVGDIYYFRRWYEEKDLNAQSKVRRLISDGQIEIVHGGATSTDEATVSFQDIIDNMIIGRHWLLKEFGVIPNVGWQLDPFGHSAANARIFADMGMDGLVFARMHNTQLYDWAIHKKKDFIW